MKEPLEIFKLEPIDRKVFFWLIDRSTISTVSWWIDHIADQYGRRGVRIDTTKFLIEAYEPNSGLRWRKD